MSVLIKDVRVILTAPEGINLVVVRVDTNQDGLYGLGCATFSYRHLAVKTVVEEYLKPLVVGQDVANIEQIWNLVHFNAYWRGGPIENNALSGLDMALWDIKGKMAGMPVYSLLGGKVREGIPIYRHADGRDAEEICDNILKYKEQGIETVRCQCGGYGGTYGEAPATAPNGSSSGVYQDARRYIRDTIKLFEDIRSIIGFEIGLCHDVHERLKPMEAIRFATELEPAKLFFLEEAIPLEEGQWYRQLRQKTVTPLAQGELFNRPVDWHYLITERLIDFLRVHISQAGGITPARKMQIFAEQFGVNIAWHGPGDMSPIGHAANIHIDLTANNLGIQEWSGTEPPNFVIQDLKGPRDALLEVFPGMPTFKDGYVYANEAPGLGIDIDEKAAAKYPCENTVTTWTRTRRRDGSLQTP